VILFHLANALYLISYAVRDILWLRLITVLAGTTLIASFLVDPKPPWPAVAWNLVFLVINLIRIHLLLRERRPVPLTADEQHLANLVFRTLRPRELVRLVRAGAIVDHPGGAAIVKRGEPLDRLLLVVRGTARVELPGKPPVEIGDGAFVGELCYLTGKPAGADVVAATALRVVAWPTAELRALLDDNPDLHVTMQQVLGADLAAKLRRA
jgi:CRP-like cAMP-binding protein